MSKLVPHANSRRKYSWWWDSHISPKNSKWLQDNLTDMDAKVKSMIKLIEEDADSFARRAEMYYKKRPELMKMVEEFYRAYRALAERYDHATGALVQAHRTMTEAFPNQLPSGLTEDELASFANENDSFESADDGKFGGRRVQRELNFDEKEDQTTPREAKLEKEIQTLREALAKFEAEKESCLAQEDSRKKKAEDEVESLNKALNVLEVEKETSLVQYRKSLERIEEMEGTISRAQKDVFDLNERAQKAEAEAQTLKLDLQRIESEKATSVDQCKKSSEKVSALENKLIFAEEEANKLKERAEEAEKEAETAKKALSELEMKISCAKEKCILLEKSNQSLNSELDSMKVKMNAQSDELEEKERAMGILWTSVQDERLRFVEAETAFQTLHHMHAQNEKEMKSLAIELQNKALMVSDLETRNQSLLNESLKIKEENESLNELNLASSVSIKQMQNEIISLLENKGKLEEEVVFQTDQKNALQQETYYLKEELNEINKRYLAMMDQVEGLQDENLNLKENQEREMREKVDLLGKLGNLEKVEEENTLLEKSLIDLSSDLEEAREQLLALEKSFRFVSEEKSTLDLEKAATVNQLQVATEDFVKLSEKNAFMENSVSDAQDEIEGLKIRLKSLQESCQVIENEKSDSVNEKGTLVSQVEITRLILKDLGGKHQELEEKYSVLEKVRESLLCEVKELESIVKESKDKEEKQMIEIENLHGKVLDMQATSVTLQEENLKLQDENTSLVKDFIGLQEKNNTLEGEIFLILGETASLSNLSLIFKNIIKEKSLEIEELRSNVDKLQGVSIGFESKIGTLEDKLEEAQLENMDLKKLLKRTEDSLSAVSLVNCQLNFEIEYVKNLLCEKETEISKAKCKVADTEDEKLELQDIVADLKEKNDGMKILSDEVNCERNNEVNYWESEATELISELHISSVFRSLLEEKFLEHSRVLKQLEEETYSKDRDIVFLRESISTLKDSISCFKQLQKTKILEELSLDSQKLANFQITVQDMKRKVEMSEKRIDISEGIKGQLVEAEEEITQLSDLNGKLMKIVNNLDDEKGMVESEENSNLRRKLSEQARKVSERIGHLELEVQKIQLIIVKLDNENGKDKIKRESVVTEARRRTSLRDYLGLRRTSNREKRVFCGCGNSPSTAD